MSGRTILVIILALVFGGSAAVGVNLLRNQEAKAGDANTVPVVIATGDISLGSAVTADQVKTVYYPKDVVPPGSISKVEDALEHSTLQTILKDEVLLDRKLAAKNAGSGLSSIIPVGMRAFTIHTPSVASHLAGFVRPGNNVDVLLTLRNIGPENLTGGHSTSTLLQNVKILAVDRHLDAPIDSKEGKKETQTLQSVTLLVTPDQANKLDLGQSQGTLHLTLRSPNDTSAAVTRPATLNDLQFHQEKPWSDQAKEVLAAVGKLFEKKKEEPAEEVKGPKPPPTPPPPVEIRTLRGRTNGVVLVEPITGPSDGR